MKKTGLWIGRFQPYTKGHESGLNQIISSGIEKLIVGIGSAEEEWSAKNPMSYYEREKMISKYFSNKAIGIDFEIHPIPDFGNTKKWTNFILTNLPDFDTVYSANPYVEICFKDNGKNFSRLEVNSNSIKASYVRSLIANKNETWKNYVPNIVANYLEEIKLEERLENLIKKEEPRNPDLAVDGIVHYNGGIVLIERKNPPYGLAFPGGFVDRNIESCDDAIIREIKEEINLDVVSLKQFRLYSEPKRDPRGHIASMVYDVKAKGELKAKDDASKARVFSNEEIVNSKLAFDHGKIFQDYLHSIDYDK